MKWKHAKQSVLDYLAQDYSRTDLDATQVDQLIQRLVDEVKDIGDTILPQAVARHVDKLFPKYQRVVPPRHAALSGDEIDAKIRSAIQENDDHWFEEDSYAYIAPIRKKILAARETVYYTAAGLKKFLDEAALPIKGAIERALVNGWSSSNYQRFQAGDKFVLQTFRREGHLDETSPETYRGIINALGAEQGWALNQNGVNNRYDTVAAKAKASILKNGTFPVWSPGHGQIRWRDARDLDALDPDQLVATITAAKDLYKKMGESREAQQERLQDLADTAAGHRKYRAADQTELDGQVQFKEGPGAKYEFVGEHSQVKPTADPRMDRSASISAPLPPNVAKLFTDKATGKFYTKTALHKLARTNTNLFRTMMRSGYVDFMNQLLAQPE